MSWCHVWKAFVALFAYSFHLSVISCTKSPNSLGQARAKIEAFKIIVKIWARAPESEPISLSLWAWAYEPELMSLSLWARTIACSISSWNIRAQSERADWGFPEFIKIFDRLFKMQIQWNKFFSSPDKIRWDLGFFIKEFLGRRSDIFGQNFRKNFS